MAHWVKTLLSSMCEVLSSISGTHKTNKLMFKNKMKQTNKNQLNISWLWWHL